MFQLSGIYLGRFMDFASGMESGSEEIHFRLAVSTSHRLDSIPSRRIQYFLFQLFHPLDNIDPRQR